MKKRDKKKYYHEKCKSKTDFKKNKKSYLDRIENMQQIILIKNKYKLCLYVR